MAERTMNDAMGNPIIKGQTYAYSANSDGIWHVTFGEVDGFTEKKVRLKNCWTRRGAYGNLKDWYPMKRAVSVYGAALFPVTNAIVTATQKKEDLT